MPASTRRLLSVVGLLSLAVAFAGCKPTVPSGQVRPAGNGGTPAPSSNFNTLGNGNSSTTVGGGQPATGS